MNARYYVSEIGRFASADTIVPDPGMPQSFNRYSYVLNSPLRYSDPSGHLSVDEVNNYFDYQGETLEQLWDTMLADGLSEEYIGWLLDPDTTWGDVATLYNDDGSRRGEVMLALFETAPYSDTYRGGLYGLNEEFEGQEVDSHSISSLEDQTLKAIQLKTFYENNYGSLPSEQLLPGTYYKRNFVGDLSGAFTIAGVTTVGIACVASVAGIPACLGTGAALAGGTFTVAGGITYGVTLLQGEARAQQIPIIFQPDVGPGGHIYRQAGLWTWGYRSPGHN